MVDFGGDAVLFKRVEVSEKEVKFQDSVYFKLCTVCIPALNEIFYILDFFMAF